MGSVSRENDDLKLVYPRGFVEIYKSPITAAQVMERNPRHCVTRPDVFKFPWIVVRPESVLKPGRVFYVVPYHTIRRLLKSKGSPIRHHNDVDREQEQDFSFRIRPRPKIDYEFAADQFQRNQLHDHEFHRLVKKGNNAMESQNKVNTKCEDEAPEATDSPGSTYKYQTKFYRKQSVSQLQQGNNVESPKKQQVLKEWQNYMGHYENDGQKSEQQVYLLFENLKVEDSLPRGELKSCLKKHNDISKSRGLRVRFALDKD